MIKENNKCKSTVIESFGSDPAESEFLISIDVKEANNPFCLNPKTCIKKNSTITGNKSNYTRITSYYFADCLEANPYFLRNGITTRQYVYKS